MTELALIDCQTAAGAFGGITWIALHIGVFGADYMHDWRREMITDACSPTSGKCVQPLLEGGRRGMIAK